MTVLKAKTSIYYYTQYASYKQETLMAFNVNLFFSVFEMIYLQGI